MRKERELVIEVERVQRIQKRAKTKIRHCGFCRAETDFVSLRDAAELFERKHDELLLFLRKSNCHYREEENGQIEICLSMFLKAIDDRVNSSTKLIGE